MWEIGQLWQASHYGWDGEGALRWAEQHLMEDGKLSDDPDILVLASLSPEDPHSKEQTFTLVTKLARQHLLPQTPALQKAFLAMLADRAPSDEHYAQSYARFVEEVTQTDAETLLWDLDHPDTRIQLLVVAAAARLEQHSAQQLLVKALHPSRPMRVLQAAMDAVDEGVVADIEPFRAPLSCLIRTHKTTFVQGSARVLYDSLWGKSEPETKRTAQEILDKSLKGMESSNEDVFDSAAMVQAYCDSFQDIVTHKRGASKDVVSLVKAATALGPAARPLLPMLIEMLKRLRPSHENAYLGDALISCMQAIGDPQAAPALLEEMRTSGSVKPWLQPEAACALAHLLAEPPEECLARLQEGLEEAGIDSGLDLRRAMDALARFGPKAAVCIPRLQELAEASAREASRRTKKTERPARQKYEQLNQELLAFIARLIQS